MTKKTNDSPSPFRGFFEHKPKPQVPPSASEQQARFRAEAMRCLANAAAARGYLQQLSEYRAGRYALEEIDGFLWSRTKDLEQAERLSPEGFLEWVAEQEDAHLPVRVRHWAAWAHDDLPKGPGQAATFLDAVIEQPDGSITFVIAREQVAELAEIAALTGDGSVEIALEPTDEAFYAAIHREDEAG